MPNWTDTPPTESEHYALRIVRTPPTGAIEALITTPGITGCHTHFIKNRTVPCEGQPGCQFCEAGHSFRWHAYLAAVLVRSYEQVLFECTAIAAKTFINYREINGTLRACRFRASRPSGRPNGRIVIACKAEDETLLRLPKPPDVKTILCHIWNVKAESATTLPDRPHAGRLIRPGQPNGDGRYNVAKPIP